MDKFIKIRQKTGRWETRNKMERRRSQNDGRMLSMGWRLGGETSLEIGCRKTTMRHRATTYTTNFKVKAARETGIDRDRRIYMGSPAG
jgi:hypothetical protein